MFMKAFKTTSPFRNKYFIFGLWLLNMRVFACPAALLFAISIPLAPTKANAGFASATGEFKFSWLLPHEESCRTGKPQGSYSSSNGSSGIVYPADCESPFSEGDTTKYNFVESNGSNSCSGVMTMNFSPNRIAYTRWRVTSATPGHACGSVGSEYEIEMQYR